MKTTRLPFNSLAGCLEETQQSSQRRERVGAEAFSHSRRLAGKLLAGRPLGYREQRASVLARVRGRVLITAPLCTALLYPLRWMGLCCCQTGWTKPQAADDPSGCTYPDQSRLISKANCQQPGRLQSEKEK